jgi:hypothetical protein
MTFDTGKSSPFEWQEWQSILINLFDSRTDAFYPKSYLNGRNRAYFIALFLQVNCPQSGESSILSEVLQVLRRKAVNDPRFDSLAMLGHRFGLVENTSELKNYFQTVHDQFAPAGRILLTSVDTGSLARPTQRAQTHLNSPSASLEYQQFQQPDLIGPYFSMSFFTSETIQNQSSVSGWSTKVVYQPDGHNYLVCLTIV